jgi:hypothetical protein
MATDLKTLAARDTDTFTPLNGEGKSIAGASITVYGPGSRQYAQAHADRQARMLDLAKATGRDTPLTLDEQRKENAIFLADVTAGVDGLAYGDLAGREMVIGAYSDASLGFIPNQVQARINDWANFTKALPSA